MYVYMRTHIHIFISLWTSDLSNEWLPLSSPTNWQDSHCQDNPLVHINIQKCIYAYIYMWTSDMSNSWLPLSSPMVKGRQALPVQSAQICKQVDI